MSNEDGEIPYIYFAQVRGGGPIKIGCSYGPLKRILQLQAWCPFPLDFRAARKGEYFSEAVLHDLQKDFCIHGEWFEPNPALEAMIVSVIETGRLPEDVRAELQRRWDAHQDALDAKDARDQERRRLRMKRGLPAYEQRFLSPRTEESKRSFREKRAASDARRKAAKGNGRTVEFKVVADPINAPE